MAVFAVILQEEDELLASRIVDKFDDCHEISPTVFIVSSGKLSDEVAILAGIKGQERVSDTGGVVLKLEGSFAGFASPSIWEWIKTHRSDF